MAIKINNSDGQGAEQSWMIFQVSSQWSMGTIIWLKIVKKNIFDGLQKMVLHSLKDIRIP